MLPRAVTHVFAMPRDPAATRGRALGWAGGAVASLLLGGIALTVAPLGALAHHMAMHLLLMNAVAPLVALAVRAAARTPVPGLASWRAPMGASVVQLVLLWGWHAPPALVLALGIPAIHAVMQMSCLAAALWFWLAILADHSAMRWRALFALLITGKLFCLLGALLVFAPRLLYGAIAAHGLHGGGHDAALADQHLAGLLMLAVCPLTYVLAGVVIAAQWLYDLARAPERSAPRDAMAAH
jgi:putative membrane protein